ncbi:S8 family serine peptidase [Catellatospora chokoriensis]|uniref:Serine protease n=1 Tax=Catellatospora chokoriensis TaxID=310353 RepID=A0A8J3NUL2_9ACTN|nr:S8 family serine peptidase [Catellatospora chokoriensis]GIF92998.1 serine protease [Catellatospora chokoriensis]
MRWKRTLSAALLLPAGLLAGPLPVTAQPASAIQATAAPTGAATPQARAGQTVTLVTGDRVTVGDGTAVSIQPAKGREHVTFATSRSRGRLRVIPSDAMTLLAAGRLDPRLFDVTALLEYGYDARRAELPLIVTADGTSTAQTRSAAAAVPAGGRVRRQLPRLGVLSVAQDRAQAAAFWRELTGQTGQAMRPGIAKVWLDGLLKPTLDGSVAQIGAPAAWQAGLTGQGVTVAVLDTGIDDTHPDLAGRVTARSNFTGGVDQGGEDDRDLAGHGTHVASIVAGSGAASGGRYRGVAPDVRLLDGKVCVEWGCAESWILAGMQWAAQEQRARIVNMSLGGWDSPGTDPLEEAVETLTRQYGTLFVIAAGNDGPYATSVSSPASADAALAVGAVSKADAIADFSGRGPRTGDGGIKPDLTAPGVEITAARSKDAPGLGGEPGDPYVSLSGTSMATPHAAGAAAILAQQHPAWTGARIKAALMGTARPNPSATVFDQGAGRVDVAAAVGQAVTAEPGSLSFGRQLWPHGDDAVLTRAVTYTNSSATPITLDLAATATIGGSAAPAGMFTVDPARLTVPAGGSAQATVTADTRVTGPDGLAAGALTATGADGSKVRTPFAVDREVESYTVTLEHLDRAGRPAQFADDVTRYDGLVGFNAAAADGTVTLRMPKGRYALSSWLADRADPALTLLVHPALDVTADRVVTFDARLGRTSMITVPRPAAVLASMNIAFSLQTPHGPVVSGQGGSSFANLYTADVGDGIPAAGFTSFISAVFAKAGTDADGYFHDSPWVYTISHHQANGRLISGYRRDVAEGELATLPVAVAAGDEPMDGLWGATSSIRPGREDETPVFPIASRLPSTTVHYVDVEPGKQWRARLYRTWTDPGSGDGWRLGPAVSGWTAYVAGRTYEQRWNQAVFGPAFAAVGDATTGVTRSGDVIDVDLSLYGDGAGRVDREVGPGTTVLYRDGLRVGSAELAGRGAFTVPPDDAGYRLEVAAARGAPFTSSTQTTAAWTFRSGHTTGVLPLWAVRFSPALDRFNTAPAGRSFTVPVSVVAQPGAAVGKVSSLTVDVSYDDGGTWTRTAVHQGMITLRHPAGAGFVSLRAVAADTRGNKVEQAILRAYRFGG